MAVPTHPYAVWIEKRTGYISTSNGRHAFDDPTAACVGGPAQHHYLFNDAESTYKTRATRLHSKKLC